MRERLPWIAIGAAAGSLACLGVVALLGDVSVNAGAWAAGVSALTGLVVGHYLTREDELRRWLRDQRADALAGFIEATYLTTTSSGQALGPVTNKSIAAMARVELLAPPELAKLSSALHAAAWQYALLAQRGEDAQSEKDLFFSRWHEFVRQSREAVGVQGAATTPGEELSVDIAADGQSPTRA